MEINNLKNGSETEKGWGNFFVVEDSTVYSLPLCFDPENFKQNTDDSFSILYDSIEMQKNGFLKMYFEINCETIKTAGGGNINLTVSKVSGENEIIIVERDMTFSVGQGFKDRICYFGILDVIAGDRIDATFTVLFDYGDTDGYLKVHPDSQFFLEYL